MSTTPMTWIDGKQYAVTPVTTGGGGGTTTGEPTMPANAKIVDLITATGWKWNHDLGTPGSATGQMTYPFKAPDGSTVRQVKFTATGKGGFICHIDVLSDSRPFNCFCLEKVEAAPRWLDTGQVETDFEKTGPLGQVYDGAMQQSTSGGEEITINGHWTPVGINIDPAKRVPLILHTTRNWLKFNADGSITYRGVFQDGTYYSINKTATDQQGKPWAPNILNYQNQYNSNQSASTDFEFWLYSLKAYCWFE